MRRTATSIRILTTLAAGLCACKKPPPPAPPPPTVRAVELTTHSIERTHEWLATLDGSTNAEIRPRVEGYIQSVDYHEGSFVKEGTLLFTIDKRPLEAAALKARGDYETAVAQLNKARADVARYAPLLPQHAISREEFENARASERVGLANVHAARGTLESVLLNLNWASVRSPIAGIAGIAQTRVGTLANPNQVLTVVSTVDPIRASFAISEREYLRYAELLNQINNPQSQARGYLELLLIDGRVHPYRAGKVIVNRQVDPSTGTLTLQALFPNPGNILRPGLFSKVRSHEGQEADAVLVPERAVQELQGSYRVSVVGPDQRVQVRPVQLGPLLGHSYVVESGLRAGERVIVEGLENVQPGAKVNVQLLPAPQASAAADPGTAATTDPPEPVAGPAGPESRRQGRTAPGARKAR